MQPSECTARQARAVVRNRSQKTVDVDGRGSVVDAQGGSVAADAEGDGRTRPEKALTVPAPAGATADIGCQASKSDVAVHR